MLVDKYLIVPYARQLIGMEVFKYQIPKELWHLIYAKGWGADAPGALIGLRVQFFCQDMGYYVTNNKYKKFDIAKYEKESHFKKLCPECVRRAKKSKKHGPAVERD